MLSKHYTNKIIFLNIETVPQYAKFEDLLPKFQALFLKKHDKEYHEKTWTLRSNSLGKEERKQTQEDMYSKYAALTPEWGKIACISFLVMDENYKYHSMSITGDDEKAILQDFLKTCPSIANWPKLDTEKKKVVCSYSGFGFTWPYIAHRFLINGLQMPPMFDYSEGKPWEQEHLISLMNIWNYNRSSSYTSLETLCATFGVDHTDYGSHVSGWHNTKDFTSLKDYGEERCVSLATVYLRIKGISNSLIKVK